MIPCLRWDEWRWILLLPQCSMALPFFFQQRFFDLPQSGKLVFVGNQVGSQLGQQEFCLLDFATNRKGLTLGSGGRNLLW